MSRRLCWLVCPSRVLRAAQELAALELTFTDFAVSPRPNALSVPQVVFPCATIFVASIGIFLYAMTVTEACLVVAFIDLLIWPHVATLTFLDAELVISVILGAAYPFMFSTAVPLVVLPGAVVSCLIGHGCPTLTIALVVLPQTIIGVFV